jgi:hypothetical protein
MKRRERELDRDLGIGIFLKGVGIHLISMLLLVKGVGKKELNL